MEIKCKQPGCPFEYEHCCIECEELEHCTSSCNLKPDSCKNSEMNGETSLQVLKMLMLKLSMRLHKFQLPKSKLKNKKKQMSRVQDRAQNICFCFRK